MGRRSKFYIGSAESDYSSNTKRNKAKEPLQRAEEETSRGESESLQIRRCDECVVK